MNSFVSSNLVEKIWDNTSLKVDLNCILSDHLEDESFISHLSLITDNKKEITLKAKNEISLAYGASQLLFHLKNGFTSDVLGKKTAQFNLRPLWLTQKRLLKVSDDFSITFPHFESIEKNCIEAIKYGFNAIVFGSLSKHGQSPTVDILDFLESCKIVKSYGLKVIVAPTFVGSNACPGFIDLKPLEPLLECADYVFWQSLYFMPTFDSEISFQDLTYFELLLKEVLYLENSINKKLIFYLPPIDTYLSKQVQWLDQLSNEIGPRTILSFSAVNGDPGSSHLAPHPYFTELRRSFDSSSTKLLPIFHIGFEGFKNIFSFLSLEKILPYLIRHTFVGMVTITNFIPEQDTLLSAGLWCIAQALWHRRVPILLFESWQRALFPEKNFHELMKVLKEAEYVLHELQSLKEVVHLRENMSHDTLKMHVDHLATFLNHIYNKRILPLGFFDEVKPHLQQTAQSLSVSLPQLFQDNPSITPSFLLRGRSH
jgi:hypothetical protein